MDISKGQRTPVSQLVSGSSFQLAVTTVGALVVDISCFGLDMAQMALAYVTQQPFVTSNIIGATTLAQLHSNIASWNLVLSPEVIKAIGAVHTQQPNPAP